MPSLDPPLPSQIETDASGVELTLRIVDGLERSSGPLELVVWMPNPTGEGWMGPPMGLWRFPKVPIGTPLDLKVELGRISDSSVTLSDGAARLEPEVAMAFGEYRAWPRQSVGVSIVGDQGAVHQIARFDIVSSSPQILERHYSRRGHQEAYIPVEDHFGEAFHAARIEQARRLVSRVATGNGPVLDAGSGYSLLNMAKPQGGWRFKLVCCDWDQAAMARMAVEERAGVWVAGAANCLPFGDAKFDVVYVGEVIEHLVDPAAGVTEWARVLRSGGHLIVTTPNRLHRLNRLQQSEAPENLEHLREYIPQELRDELEGAGLSVVHLEGLYLAALAYRPPGGDWVDPLRVRSGFRGKGRLLDAAMKLGKRLPEQAWNICAVAKKP